MKTVEMICRAQSLVLTTALWVAWPAFVAKAVAAPPPQVAATQSSGAAQSDEEDGPAMSRRDEEEDTQAERLTDLYDDGREALDEQEYERAVERFSQLSGMAGAPVDAALYWKAYAENRLGKRDDALASLKELKRRFPKSRWLKDAGALELEVRQSTGAAPRPEAQSDEELKLLALQGLMRSDPQRALPMLEKVLNGGSTGKVKSQALFVLAQSGSPQSREILARIAKGQRNPELQQQSVQYLGLFGGTQAKQTLAEVYASSSDVSVKRTVLRSYMVSGDKGRLFDAAKSERNEALKSEAVRQLGMMHAQNELQQLYKTENSIEVRRALLQAFFLAGDAKKLVEAAQNEANPHLRQTAVRNLGLINSPESRQALQEIYTRETDRELRKDVLNAYFVQGNARAIVAIARTEKDPALKAIAVSKLSLMNSKEGTDYLMEILEK